MIKELVQPAILAYDYQTVLLGMLLVKASKLFSTQA
jgi:hypothetical protein